ncbi:MAG TPA: L-threonylcarbamoyladenylate synthase [Patescibacteria group bacterium]|nr:L-threonylcarbamoyladenylate synthase [Patescibacteria group bacterium]
MKKYLPEQISEITHCLLHGETAVFPTETSYGLGCDARNVEAVEKIFAIKGRNKTKSLLVIVPSIEEAKKYLVWNEELEKLASKYWPGPLTIVSEAVPSKLPLGVVAADGTLAVRVTAVPWLQTLTTNLREPLVGTSANITGLHRDLYDPEEVVNEFLDRDSEPDILVDGGLLPQRLPTTIVSVVGRGLKILRQGELKIA